MSQNMFLSPSRKAPSPDDPLAPLETQIAGRSFWNPVWRLGRLPEVESVARRLAAGWNVLIGLSDAELADLEPGELKRLRDENARLKSTQPVKDL